MPGVMYNQTLDFRAFRAFFVNGHLPKTCRRCCKYPSSSNPEPEPQVHSSGQFQIGWDAGKQPHDSGVKTVDLHVTLAASDIVPVHIPRMRAFLHVEQRYKQSTLGQH